VRAALDRELELGHLKSHGLLMQAGVPAAGQYCFQMGVPTGFDDR
jgi:hypothetical protein